nr:23S rRNA (guanosine(2251)-2'-O)-methyltransferase RlmB [Eubacterium sp.]
DLIGDVEKLKQKKIKIFGMHLDGSSMYETDLTGAVAFLIGNEGAGLTSELCDKADKLIRIPMKGEVESLNAAISASLISYETMRQRSGITFF